MSEKQYRKRAKEMKEWLESWRKLSDDQKSKLLIEAGQNIVKWSELEPLLHEMMTKLLKLFELYEKEFKRIRQKQTEFETRFKRIWKKLLEVGIDQAKKR